ncbi:hypothetical protein FM120_25185 [Sphingobacterium faecium PCAi_F2.5]|nr:hypothetical protein FM120_25185 [Sphingobacterium faecium PCAi_F2.5]
MLSAPFHSTNSSLLYVSFLIETNKITSLFKKAEEKFLDFSSAFFVPGSKPDKRREQNQLLRK